MANVRIYNVWHNKLFNELYDGVSDDDLANIVMFGVNESYEKEFDANRGYNVQYEWDLAKYNPMLQQHGYCQTTAMYHIYKNGLHRGLDYIGFIQFDMKVRPAALSNIRQGIAAADDAGKKLIFHELTLDVDEATTRIEGVIIPYESSALQHYNAFFGTDYTPQDIAYSGFKLPLVHTFIIPVATFEKMMEWICTYIDWLESIHPQYVSNRSQSELLETCHGMFLVIECIRNPNFYMMDMTSDIEHIWPLYHDKTDYKNYKKIV